MGRKVWQKSSAVYDVFSMRFMEIKLAAHNPDPTEQTAKEDERNERSGFVHWYSQCKCELELITLKVPRCDFSQWD